MAVSSADWGPLGEGYDYKRNIIRSAGWMVGLLKQKFHKSSPLDTFAKRPELHHFFVLAC